MMNLHPFWTGHVASLFAGEMQGRFFADPQHLPNHVHRLDAGRVSVLVEESVAGHFECVSESDGAMRVTFRRDPASEKVVAVAHTAAAIVFRVREIFSSAQSGERRDELEG